MRAGFVVVCRGSTTSAQNHLTMPLRNPQSPETLKLKPSNNRQLRSDVTAHATRKTMISSYEALIGL